MDVGDVPGGHEVVTREKRRGRPTNRWFRGAVAGVLAAVTAVSGVVLNPTPAQANPALFVNVAINVPISVTGLFGGSGVDKAALEAAKRQIINAINDAANEIKDHLERLEIGTLTACVNAAIIDLEASSDFPIDPKIDFALEATRCAIRIHEQMKVVQNRRHVDSLGYLTLVAFPAAMAARAQAGLPNDEVLVSYIQALELTIDRLAPACGEERPQDRPDYLRYYCIAVDGTRAEYTQRADRGPIPDFYKAQVLTTATRNISRAAAVAVLPAMRQLLPKLRRSFIFNAVQSGQVMQWNTQGPHFWDVVGNQGEATAVASTIDANNNRHIVAVIDGEVRHRIRNQNGTFTPWTTPGALGHSGTATAVTAVAETNGHVFVLAIVNGQVMYRFWVGEGAWTSWQWLGNPGPATAVATAADSSGLLHAAVVIGGEVRYWHNRTDGSWAPWTAPGTLGHPGTATAVTAIATQNRELQVAAVIDGNVRHRVLMADASWSPWIDLNNPGTATAVAGGVDPNGDVQFVIVDDEQVHQRTRFQNISWSDEWASVEALPFDSFGTTAISAS